ncbi:hypothetical protein VNO77_35276 [Canavalia gladiata]|uniref:Retrotransposon gag domain-containing protein n=1 Tax=Canavalia gladiata TaxID=3824 RepID=A0AAN9Q284_CANGL
MQWVSGPYECSGCLLGRLECGPWNEGGCPGFSAWYPTPRVHDIYIQLWPRDTVKARPPSVVGIKCWVHGPLKCSPWNEVGAWTLGMKLKKNNKAGKLFLRHPYRTRSQSKIMDELEQQNEELRSELNQLKEQMALVLGALRALEKKDSEQTPQAQSKTPLTLHYNKPVQEHVDSQEDQWPEYGLPLLQIRVAADLCLVPDVVIPPKFKVPEFDRYKGTTCPKSHLTMYCRKMASHAHDDKLLIHFFQDSLTGAASSWYMHLERSHIRCWKDLADAFLKQYKYNIDMAPDRWELQSMSKKDQESFKEYAQRWRELAAQVEPPLSDKEMSRNGLKSGKIAHIPLGTNTAKKPSTGSVKKKEGEANAVSTS